jgi:hypothetical protein
MKFMFKILYFLIDVTTVFFHRILYVLCFSFFKSLYLLCAPKLRNSYTAAYFNEWYYSKGRKK